MTDTNETKPVEPITIYLDDEVLFRLLDGKQPLAYSDSVAQAAYDIGMGVVHTGALWSFGLVNGVEAIELDDGTVVAVADIDRDSLVVTPAP